MSSVIKNINLSEVRAVYNKHQLDQDFLVNVKPIGLQCCFPGCKREHAAYNRNGCILICSESGSKPTRNCKFEKPCNLLFRTQLANRTLAPAKANNTPTSRRPLCNSSCR